MATCAKCGKWAGLFRKRHDVCAGEEANVTFAAASAAPVQIVSVRTGNIISGVFLGMWLFSLSVAILWIIARVLFGSMM